MIKELLVPQRLASVKPSADNVYILLMKEMYRAFHFFNKHFAKGKLPEPVITIASVGKENKKAHFAHHIWVQGANKLHEIHLGAEHLVGGVFDTCEHLLHEMAHEANFEHHKKVVDCNHQQRHNMVYKATAEKFGLNVENHPRYGYGITDLIPATKKLITEQFKPNLELFKLYRKHYNEMKKRKDNKKSKLTPVMIGKDTKLMIQQGAKSLGMTQKDFTTKAVKAFAKLPELIKKASVQLVPMDNAKEIEVYLFTLMMQKQGE